ncbi:hypothetical protein AHAS_Ahas08G0083000 [Arachis hypogaea]
MEEIQSQSDNYRSSSSSASSPASRVPSSNFFYLRKPGSIRQPISFEDSPEWEDTDTDLRIEEGGDSINAATTPASPSLSKINSGSLPSPRVPEGVVIPRKIAGASGYVERETTLIGSLTVREFLSYSALLQLPGFLCQKKSVVEDAIHAMSLDDHANKLIGGHCYMKGLPSGERRLVSIARELVMRPRILFIDEPLYHLDCVAALLMMVTLKRLASTGCTLIVTIYQSSTEVFGLFDRICLLSNGNTLFFGETLACLQHFSNAGFPCPIMQSPSDHFLRAINTDFDRIIAMCKNWQDDNGDFSSVNMDTAVAIRTLEATYKSSADAAAVETMILKLTEKEGPALKSKGKANNATRIAVLTWRSLLVVSREWKYYWLHLILYMLLTLCIGTVFSGLGHSLSSVATRVAAIFVFVSFCSLLSIARVPALMKEIKIYTCEESNEHSSTIVFLLAQLLSSIPFLFLIAISSSLVFYFLVRLQDQFSLLMYFVLNFFMTLLVNEGIMLIVAALWQDVLGSLLTLLCIHVVMMLSAGYFRMRNALPGPVWMYPMSYIAFHTYSIQGLLENEYLENSFAVGQVRTISGFQALQNVYNISAEYNSKWKNLLVLFVMAMGYRIIVLVLLFLLGSRKMWLLKRFKCNRDTTDTS